MHRLIIVLCFWVLSVCERPGECPDCTCHEPHIFKCVRDEDCPETLKCCNGCSGGAAICVKPVFPEHPDKHHKDVDHKEKHKTNKTKDKKSHEIEALCLFEDKHFDFNDDCFAHCSDGAINPRCPLVFFDWKCAQKKNPCKYDTDCGIDQICCPSGCGLFGTKCIDSCHEDEDNDEGCNSNSDDHDSNDDQDCDRDYSKCPNVKLNFHCIQKINPCRTDKDCGKYEICCPNGCGINGTSCVDVRNKDDKSDEDDYPKVKPGVCPKVPPNLQCAYRPLCKSDRDCEGKAKCCPTGCGTMCYEPPNNPKPKPGECPVVYFNMDCQNDRSNPCDVDQDCRGPAKCCPSGCGSCGTMCYTPNSDNKPGTCPRVGMDLDCDLVILCSSDKDCKNADKCCRSGCGPNGTMCFAPISDPNPKPGTCPREVFYLDCINKYKYVPCSVDSDCRGDGKCCPDGCGVSGRMCYTPKSEPTVCPLIKVNENCKPKSQCRTDNDCKGKAKCCHSGCGNGTMCFEQVIDPMPNPGTCPPVCFILDCERDSRPCTYDTDCRRGFKCCPNGCGLFGTVCYDPNGGGSGINIDIKF